MKYPKSFEKLDMVLTYFKNHPDKEISINHLFGYLQLTYPNIFTLDETKAIFNELLNDRHIVNAERFFYKITLEGCVFMESGGYTVKRRSNFIKRRYRKMARRSGDQSSNLVLWTMAIIGLILAGLLIQYGFSHWNWQIPF